MRTSPDQQPVEVGRFPTVVRPYVIVSIGAVATAVAIATLVLVSAAEERSVDGWVAAVFFTLISVWIVVAVARERIEFDNHAVRIRRALASDTVWRSEVVAVHRAGGRGKSSFIALNSGRETNSRFLDLTGPVRLRRTTGAVPTPTFIFPSQIARALDVPC